MARDLTISEAFELYRDEVVVLKGQSARTEEGLLTTKKVITKAFKDCPIEELTLDDVRKWHRGLLNKKLTHNTIRGYVLHLRVVLRHAKASGYDCIDAEKITVPKRVESVPEVLTAKQVQHLIDSIKPARGRKKEYVPRNKAIVSMLYATGLRASELCSLERDVWDKKKATVVGKGGKPRLVFWDQRTHELLTDYIATRKDNNQALFVSPISGKRMGRYDIIELFTKLKEQSGIKTIHAHTLRHSFATNLMQNGMHIYTLSRLMGHSSIQTTQRYLHLADTHLEADYAKHHSI